MHSERQQKRHRDAQTAGATQTPIRVCPEYAPISGCFRHRHRHPRIDEIRQRCVHALVANQTRRRGTCSSATCQNLAGDLKKHARMGSRSFFATPAPRSSFRCLMRRAEISPEPMHISGTVCGRSSAVQVRCRYRSSISRAKSLSLD